MKKFFQDFKAFIARGNVMDMAVGVIIGGAFSKIITSLVNDILMPLISMALGGHTLAGLSIVLNGKPKYVPDSATGVQVINPEALLWNYGNFIQAIIDFLIVALVIFIILRIVMSASAKREALLKKAKGEEDAKKAEEAAKAEPVEPKPTTEELLAEIRDLLAKQKK